MSIAIVLIVSFLITQTIVFVIVNRKIKALKLFFPMDIDQIQVRNVFAPDYLVESSDEFDEYISNIDEDDHQKFETTGEGRSFELLIRTKKQKKNHPEFNNVIVSSNAYLSKNQGSADYNILKDICERYIDRLDNSIGNLINVPLYLGLAGTFAGI